MYTAKASLNHRFHQMVFIHYISWTSHGVLRIFCMIRPTTALSGPKKLHGSVLGPHKLFTFFLFCTLFSVKFILLTVNFTHLCKLYTFSVKFTLFSVNCTLLFSKIYTLFSVDLHFSKRLFCYLVNIDYILS